MGFGVRTLNLRKLGVSFSRLCASAKKGNTASRGWGRTWVARSSQIRPSFGSWAGLTVISFIVGCVRVWALVFNESVVMGVASCTAADQIQGHVCLQRIQNSTSAG